MAMKIKMSFLKFVVLFLAREFSKVGSPLKLNVNLELLFHFQQIVQLDFPLK